MMENYIDILKKCVIFKNMTDTQISDLYNASCGTQKTYHKGEFIFDAYDKPSKLFVLATGKIGIRQVTMSGKQIVITDINKSGDVFGEVYLFLQNDTYGMTAEALENSTIIELNNIFLRENSSSEPNNNDYTEITNIMMNNFLRIFATKAYMQNKKLKILGGVDIREKIVRYIFEFFDLSNYKILLPSREDMAAFLNISRPSLSRELSHMQDNGIIKVKNRQLTISDYDKFEEYL